MIIIARTVNRTIVLCAVLIIYQLSALGSDLDVLRQQKQETKKQEATVRSNYSIFSQQTNQPPTSDNYYYCYAVSLLYLLIG